MSLVMAFGTFDLLHPGHKYFLRMAKNHGGCLIIVIARDRTVKEVKGRMPYHGEKQRQRAVKGQNIADKVILGSLTDNYAAIKKYRPKIIVLGYDQTNFTHQLRAGLNKLKLKTKIIRLKPFRARKYKTSILKHEKRLSKNI